MPPISGNIPNLIGGASQQDVTLRAPSQAEAVDNSYLSPVKGLGKRPASNYVARLLTAGQTTGDSNATDNPMIHFIRRDASEQYVLMFRSGQLKAFTLAGVVVPVIYDSGTAAYLACSTPSENLRALTIADDTFIVNRTVTPTMASVSSSTTPSCSTESVNLHANDWWIGNIPAPQATTCYACTRAGVSLDVTIRTLTTYTNEYSSFAIPNWGTDLLEFVTTGATTWDAANSRWKVLGTYRRVANYGGANGPDLRNPSDLINAQVGPEDWEYTSAYALIAPGMKLVGIQVGSDVIDGSAAGHRYHFTQHAKKSGLSPWAACDMTEYDQTQDWSTYDLYPASTSWYPAEALLYKPPIAEGYYNTCSSMGMSWDQPIMQDTALVSIDGGGSPARRKINLRRSAFIRIESTGIPDVTYCKPNVALFSVKRGNYATRHTVTVAGKTAEYTTSISDPVSIKTDYIASALASKIAVLLGTVLWSVVHRSGDSVFTVLRKDNAAFTASCTDSAANNNLVCINGDVNHFSDLPDVALWDQRVTVKGSAEGNQDDYYVKFVQDPVPTAHIIKPGVWQETAKPCTSHSYDLATMPHEIRRLQDDVSGTVTGTPNAIYFRISKGTWDARAAGDDATNPPPAFVGNPISDLFVFRNRLGVVAGPSISVSVAGEFRNFWRNSVLTAVPSDPIDFDSGTSSVINLHSAIPFANRVLAFSEKDQLKLSAGDSFTATSSRFEHENSYDSYGLVRPCVVERRLYVPFKSGPDTQIREYYIDPYNEASTSQSATDHIPTYLPGNPLAMTAVVPEKCLFVSASGARKSLYFYQWSREGEKTVLASWSRWTPAPTGSGGSDDIIYGMGAIDSKLYVVVRRTTGTELEFFNLDAGHIDTGLSYPILLDRRVSVTPTGGQYNAGGNYTTVSLPWDKPSAGTLVATPQSSVYVVGTIIPQQVGGTSAQLRLTGNWEGKALWIGLQYGQTFEFSKFFIIENRQSGPVTVTDGRLQISRLRVNFSGAVGFKSIVTPSDGRAVSEQTYARQLPAGNGSPSSTPITDSGEFIIWVGGRNTEVTIKIVNDSMFPAWFQSATWDAVYATNTRRT